MIEKFFQNSLIYDHKYRLDDPYIYSVNLIYLMSKLYVVKKTNKFGLKI